MYCGYAMRSSKSRGKHYLKCPNRHVAKDACVGSFISVARLEEIVAAELNRMNAEYLDQALTENEIASGSDSEYGLFITTVDGETADDSQQQWWCITKSGEMLMTGASETPVADGETYELTLTTGY